MRTLLRGAYVLTADENKPMLKDADILIEDDSIVYIGERKEHEFIDRVQYLYGYLITPGFINTHTHLAMTLFRGWGEDMELGKWLNEKIWPYEAKLTDEDVYYGSIVGIKEMLSTGTTAFVDMYFFEQATIDAVHDVGIRAFITPGVIEKEGWQDRIDQIVALRNTLRSDYVEVHLSLHGLYTCGPDVVDYVIEKAKETGAFVHVHLLEAPWERQSIEEKHGKDFIKKYYDKGLFNDIHVIAAHGVWMSDEEVELLANANFALAHNPQSNLKLVSGIAPIWKYLQAGMTVSIGTDGAASNNNLDLIEEVRTAGMLGKYKAENPEALPSKELFYMLTRYGAKAVQRDDIGVLAEGNKADLVVWNIDNVEWLPFWDTEEGMYAHIIYSVHAKSSVKRVWVAGKEVYRDGHLMADIPYIEGFRASVKRLFGGE